MTNKAETEKLRSYIQKVEMFSHLPEEALTLIASKLEKRAYQNQTSIFKKNDPGDAIFIVGEGKLRIHDGGHVITRIGPLDVFGEYALLDEERRSASVTTESKTLLYKLDVAVFNQLTKAHPGILKGVVEMLVKRVRSMNALEDKLTKSYLKIQKQKNEIEKQHEAIKEQKGKLEEQNYDLVQLNEEKNHLISVVVHGLKNPITSGLIMTDLLEESLQLPARELEYVHMIKKSFNRMNRMVNQLLNVNIIESKVYQLQTKPMAADQLIIGVLDYFVHTAEQKKIKIEHELNPIEIDLNEVYFIQIIDNLLSNAIKFSKEGDTLHIKLLRKNGKARIEVADQGPGIASSEIKSIFNQYQRQSESLLPFQEASGLGLAIVKKYVEAMQGKVWCESRTGEGSTFIVEFQL